MLYILNIYVKIDSSFNSKLDLFLDYSKSLLSKNKELLKSSKTFVLRHSIRA
jgi:hypothetical protein